MVVEAKVRVRTVLGKTAVKAGIVDTGSRWTWITRSLARELALKPSSLKRSARTADNRLAEGVLADEPVEIVLDGLGARLWLTPIVAEWLVTDILIGNDFMDKAGIRLVGQKLEHFDPIGELY